MGGIVKLVPLNSDFDTFFVSFFRTGSVDLSGSFTKGGGGRSILMHSGPVEPLRVAPAELVV